MRDPRFKREVPVYAAEVTSSTLNPTAPSSGFPPNVAALTQDSKEWPEHRSGQSYDQPSGYPLAMSIEDAWQLLASRFDVMVAGVKQNS